MAPNEWVTFAIPFFCLGLLGFVFLAAVGFAVVQGKKSSERSKAKSKAKIVARSELKQSIKALLLDTQVYTISLPKSSKWVPERAVAFIAHMGDFFEYHVTFRILVESGQVLWQIVDVNGLYSKPKFVHDAIKVIYPEADVTNSKYELPEISYPISRFLMWCYLQRPFYFPLVSANDIKDIDPVASLVQAMSGMHEGQRFVYTLHVSGPVDKYTFNQGKKQSQISSESKALDFGVRLVLGALAGGESSVEPLTGTGETGKGKYRDKDQKLIDEKLYDNLLLNVHLFIQSDSPVKGDFGPWDNIASVLDHQFSSPYNAWTVTANNLTEPRQVETPEAEISTGTFGLIALQSKFPNASWKKTTAVLSTQEVAAIWHLPHEGFTSNEIVWLPGGRVSAPSLLARNREGVLLGKNVFASKETPIYMLDTDRRTHVNIVGKTGVGKSTFMHNIIHQDIEAGKGVGVIDPEGKLIRDILRVSIPDRRIDDVVLVDLADEEYPPPLNPLIIPGKNNQFATNQVISLIEKFGGFEGARVVLETTTMSMLTLMYDTNPTLRDVPKLLKDREYREHLLAKSDNVDLIEYWEDFEYDLSQSEKNTRRSRVTERIRAFYRNPILQPVILHPDSLDFSDILSNGKIFLASLGIDERKVPQHDRHLLGATLISQFQMAAMSRGEGGRPFFLYVDEVQDFITSSLNDVFSRARKYGLHLTVGNQFLGQLKGDLLDAVMGTVGATIVFQLGNERDARLLAPHFRGSFESEDLVNFDLYNAAVKMRLKGETLPAFSIQTNPPPDDPKTEKSIQKGKDIREQAVKKFRSKEEVMTWLAKRYPRRRNNGDNDKDWFVPDN